MKEEEEEEIIFCREVPGARAAETMVACVHLRREQGREQRAERHRKGDKIGICPFQLCPKIKRLSVCLPER